MSGSTLFSIIESPAHPDFSRLYRRLGFEDAYPYWFRLSEKTLEPTDPDSDRESAGR